MVETGKNSSFPVTVILGSQWGDEGKGKIIDHLSKNYDMVARCAGGNNAGHTIVLPSGKKLDFHLLPSGLAHDGVLNVIGNGCVIHIPSLLQELDNCKKWGISDANDRLKISSRAQLVLDCHKEIDRIQEERKGAKSLGTTRKGIGPCYSAKANRSGVRMCDLLSKNWENFKNLYQTIATEIQRQYPELQIDVKADIDKYAELREQVEPMVCDTISLVNRHVFDDKKSILIEGANATMLDIDFGTYPFVTSSNTTVGGVCTGLGLPPTAINEVYGVTKSYCTRVGTGPFPTELGPNNGAGSAILQPDLDISDPKTDIEFGVYLQRKGHEYGVTSGRPRRCGWLDLVALKYAWKINRFDAFAMTKLDVLDGLKEVAVCVAYKTPEGETISDFPAEQAFLSECTPIYKYFDGWLSSTESCRSFDSLPENAQKYVNGVSELLGVPIKWIGVGPGRDAIITVY